MDNAVALVQTYLRLNGYFTVTEFPVIEAMRRGGHRTATDIDVLAFRFPHAGRLVPREGRSDMLIGEVKEGRAELNSAATDPAVLRAVLVRFGCCRQPDVDATVQDLVRHGRAETSPGHTTRLVAFGAHAPEGRSPRYSIVLLETVTAYLESYISSNWDVLRHAEFKDPAFGFLVTLFKSGHGRWKAHRG